VGVPAIQHHISRLQEGAQVGQHLIHRRAGLDHEDDPARALQGGLGARRRPVVDGDAEAVAGDVQGQVLPHHGQADQPDLAADL